jgi:hypothetical protein
LHAFKKFFLRSIRARIDEITGTVRSTLIGVPYYITQRYTGATDLIGGEHRTFWGQMRDVMIFNSLSPLPGILFAPLEVLADIDNVPFKEKITAKYRLSLPPADGKIVGISRYHFEVRPGASVQITQPNPTQVDLTLVLDLETYAPLPPSCNFSYLSFEEIDRRASKPGERGVLPGMSRV